MVTLLYQNQSKCLIQIKQNLNMSVGGNHREDVLNVDSYARTFDDYSSTTGVGYLTQLPDSSQYDYLIVGCGLSGAVVAERIASVFNKRVLILEKRFHIGGNCYDYKNEFGILMNLYGPHFFHTNYEDVWQYVTRFCEWIRWEHTVLAKVNNKFVTVPPNITTVNRLCGQSIINENEMDAWLRQVQVQYEYPPRNGEEMAKSRVGEQLYETIFKYYTKKQWGVFPDELDASVTARIPLRDNFDTRYFSDRYQALPRDGYTAFFESLLTHPNIKVVLNCNYFTDVKMSDVPCPIIFTGPIDNYFEDKDLPSLQYRSLEFVVENHRNLNYFQPTSQVNYPLSDVEFTRIVEYKHILDQQSPHTTIVKEYGRAEGEPYYPFPNERNQALYNKYKALAEDQTNVYFLGRLANYKYFNMDQAIHNALDFFGGM